MSLLRHRRACATVALATGAGVWLAGAGPAGAHIAPVPASAEAGRTTVVGFTVKHGCDGSPTVEVAISLPAGLGTVSGVDKAGWTVTNSATVVTFRGGELPASEAGTFELSITPTGAPRTIHLPIVQRCRQGELRWISIPEPGGPEPSYPAPALEITGPAGGATGAPAATTTAPSTAAGQAHDDGHDDDGHDEDGPTATSDSATTAVAPGGGPSKALAIGGVVVGSGVLLGAGWSLRRRRP